MRVIAEPLAGKGFAPFGEELTIPASVAPSSTARLATCAARRARACRLCARRNSRCRSPNGAGRPVGRLRHLHECGGCEGGEEFMTTPITILAQ